MATHDDVRLVARSLPGSIEEADALAFSVELKGKAKGYVWLWPERVHPKRPRVANPGVLVVRVADLEDKAALLATHPDVVFTEPHYDGYPAVLVRLDAVALDLLGELVVDAWRSLAPAELVAAYDAGS